MHHRRHIGGNIAVFAVAGLCFGAAGGGTGPEPVPGRAAEVDANLPEAIREGLYRGRGERVLSPRLDRRVRETPDGETVVWVFLTDKGVATQASFRGQLDAVRSRLLPRARERRRPLGPGLGLDFKDLPVHRGYVNALRSRGYTVRRTSRWLNAVSIRTPARRLPGLSALPFVRFVQPVLVKRASLLPPPPDPGPARPGPVLGPLGSALIDSLELEFYGPAFGQLDQIEVLDLHRMGYTGAGVTVMLLDTGFRKDHPAFAFATVLDEWDFVNEDGNVQDEAGDLFDHHAHGTGVWGTAGGFAPGDLIGPAFAADFVLAKTEDITQEVQAEEDNYVAALEWGDSLGVEVTSASLAYLTFDDETGYDPGDLDGDTAVITVAVDIAAGKGIACVNAIGNNGPAPGSLWTPADADTVLSVGAVNASGTIVSFSGRGPTADLRIKPEICALGSGTRWAVSSTLGYAPASGTSLATPLVAGLVALLKEAHPAWTGFDLRKAVIGTGSQSGSPDNSYGHGVAAGTAALTHNGAVPGPPRMTLPFYPIAPPDSAYVHTGIPTLTWTESAPSAAGDTATYAVILDDNPGFSSPDTVAAGTDTTYTFTSALQVGDARWWRVEATGNQGYTRKSFPRLFTVTSPVAAGFPPEPGVLVLAPVRPNPVRQGAIFAVKARDGEPVVLEVISVTGSLVRRFEGVGSGDIAWDGRGADGRPVPAGVYFYRLAAGTRSVTRKLVRLP